MALVLVTGAGCETGERGDGVIRVEGESAAETNIPTAPDRRASGGRYLALATAEAPPAGGWLATYEVDAPAGGRLPAPGGGHAAGGAAARLGVWLVLQVGVNGGEPAEVARSQPLWMASPAAWGDLSTLTVDEVGLHARRLSEGQ